MQSVLLGFGCNNACAFCAQGTLRDRVPTGDAEEETRLVAAAGSDVAFVGGEPTIDPRLCDLVRFAKRSGAPRVVVQTNGRRLAYRAFATALRDAGADAVDVSLHGSTAAMHDYHTSVEGSFAQTLTGLGVARAAGMAVGVTVVVTRSNYRHLVEIVRLAAARGVTAVHLAELVMAGRAAGARERLSPARELLAPYLAASRDAARTLSLDIVVGAPPSGHALFAGIGETQAPAAVPQRVALPLFASQARMQLTLETPSVIDSSLSAVIFARELRASFTPNLRSTIP